MFIKKLKKQIALRQTEALLTRLSPNHEKYADIDETRRLLLAGHNGERAITYYLEHLPDKEYFIFHNLRLPSGKYHFQLDYLILTTRFALILECKNYFGTLLFDEDFNQLIRIIEGREEGFLDPISQAIWHQTQFRNWLTPLHLPVDFLVIISKPSTIVKANPQYKLALDKVVHGHSLLRKIEQIDRKYPTEILETKELKKLCRRLLKEHTEETIKFRISKEEIITGVQCPNCEKFAMKYKQGVWTCPSCSTKLKDIHIKTLQDYALLYQPSITNREFRRFFHVDDSNAVNYLLKSMKLEHSGGTKGRVYRLDSLLEK